MGTPERKERVRALVESAINSVLLSEAVEEEPMVEEEAAAAEEVMAAEELAPETEQMPAAECETVVLTASEES